MTDLLTIPAREILAGTSRLTALESAGFVLELEARHGYDTKHAMHLVRLLRMCEEILDGRGVLTRRPDRDELLAVRNGAWPYDALIEWAEAQDAKCAALYETSTLRHHPDVEAIDRLCIEIVERSS